MSWVRSLASHYHTKDLNKNGTNCLPAWHAAHSGRSNAVQPYCAKGREASGNVYGDMHYKDLVGSIIE